MVPVPSTIYSVTSLASLQPDSPSFSVKHEVNTQEYNVYVKDERDINDMDEQNNLIPVCYMLISIFVSKKITANRAFCGVDSKVYKFEILKFNR